VATVAGQAAANALVGVVAFRLAEAFDRRRKRFLK
jgi:hypothetical protein